MLYPDIFKSLERVRWNMSTDVPWGDFDGTRLNDEQAATIKMNAITEWAALPATEMFLRDNLHDSDFSAFMSVWFFEEQKHSLVLIEYLRRFRPELAPTEDELHAVRFAFDPAPALETLMLHFWASGPFSRVNSKTLLETMRKPQVGGVYCGKRLLTPFFHFRGWFRRL